MSFVLEDLSLIESTQIDLVHPVTDEPLVDSEGNKVTVELYGTSSKQYRNAMSGMRSRFNARPKGRDGRPKPLSEEESRKEGIDFLVACSEKINNLTYKGAPVDNPAAFRELYGDPKFSWLKDQVDTALANTASFLSQ